jgi:hypothetical protein
LDRGKFMMHCNKKTMGGIDIDKKIRANPRIDWRCCLHKHRFF